MCQLSYTGPQGSAMAALSCLHRGGWLRSLPRYLTYIKRAIPGARRVDDASGDFGIRGALHLCHQHGDRQEFGATTALCGLGFGRVRLLGACVAGGCGLGAEFNLALRGTQPPETRAS